MASVETARGRIDAADLGFTLMHEHIFVRDPELEINYPNWFWSEERMVAEAVKTLTDLKAAGVSTFVDVSAPGLGRKISTMLEVARQIEINIVVATGWFCEKDLPIFFRTHGPGRRIDMPDPLHKMFIDEIRNGIAGTGVKAAIIKVATEEHGLTPDVGRVLKAAAFAHLETGAPITTHTNTRHRGGLDQQAFFRKEGVDLANVVIGHSGDSDDLDYLQQLLDAGSTIGMDRFGFSQFLNTEKRIAAIAALCERGYAGQMVLSNDSNVYSVITEPEVREEMLRKYGYEQDFFLVPLAAVPGLRALGVTESDIRKMTTENPARILGR